MKRSDSVQDRLMLRLGLYYIQNLIITKNIVHIEPNEC